MLKAEHLVEDRKKTPYLQKPNSISIQKVPNEVATTEEKPSKPLRSRLQINRENASRSTGPKTPEGKARSRANAVKHGLGSTIALPPETVETVAKQFWQLVMAYRPMDAVGVNAIFELTQCYWKNQVLFEQFASQNAKVRFSATENRSVKNRKLAQKWFARLRDDPDRAIQNLVLSTEGLSRIVSALDGLLLELETEQGTWSSSQLELAFNLAGYALPEVWDHREMREIWSAWYGSFPNKELFQTDSLHYLLPSPEFQNRVNQACDEAPEPQKSRQILTSWLESLKVSYQEMLEDCISRDEQLQDLNVHASTWPGSHETYGHLLYLRYVNQIDKKIRDLSRIISESPRHHYDFSYEFRDELLPEAWKTVLLEAKPDNRILMARRQELQLEDDPDQTTEAGWLTYQAIDQSLEETVMEQVRKAESQFVNQGQNNPPDVPFSQNVNRVESEDSSAGYQRTDDRRSELEKNSQHCNERQGTMQDRPMVPEIGNSESESLLNRSGQSRLTMISSLRSVIEKMKNEIIHTRTKPVGQTEQVQNELQFAESLLEQMMRSPICKKNHEQQDAKSKECLDSQAASMKSEEDYRHGKMQSTDSGQSLSDQFHETHASEMLTPESKEVSEKKGKNRKFRRHSASRNSPRLKSDHTKTFNQNHQSANPDSPE